jgi:replicative DNA helicase
MISEYVKCQLLPFADERLQKVPGIRGAYICPICRSGTGPKGTPAFRVKGNTWKCFSCGKGGDIADLIQHTLGCSQKEAIASAERFAGIDRPYEKEKPAQEEKTMETKTKADNAEFIKKCQEHLQNTPRAIEYAARRGIELADLKEWGWGADPDRYDSIVIPKDGGMYEERAITDICVSHYKAPGQEDTLLWSDALYNPNGQDVFVVEAPFDAASIRKIGYQATALCSTNNFPLLIKKLKEKMTKNTLIIALDKDEVGVKAVKKYRDDLAKTGVKFYIADDVWSECKDANELAVKDPNEFVDRLIKVQYDALESFDRAKEEYVEENSAFSLIDAFLDNIRSNKYVPIATGFLNFDRVMGGGIRPLLYAVGAAPSFGKTTWTLQLADQLAEAGHDVLFFSLEMSEDEIMAKSVSRHSFDICGDLEEALSSEDITNGDGHYFFSDDRKKLFADSVEKYRSHARHNFIFEGQWNTTVKTIKDKTEHHIKVTSSKPLIIVDYLQMISHESDRLSDKQIVDQAVLELKRMSRDLEIPVIVISSFNRDGYTKATMSSFKESGAIEYGADVLLGLEPRCEETDAKGKPVELNVEEFKNNSSWDMNLKILKNRNGRTGSMIRFEFLPKCNKFIPIGK